jgi:hypothetical protein
MYFVDMNNRSGSPYFGGNELKGGQQCVGVKRITGTDSGKDNEKGPDMPQQQANGPDYPVPVLPVRNETVPTQVQFDKPVTVIRDDKTFVARLPVAAYLLVENARGSAEIVKQVDEYLHVSDVPEFWPARPR